MSEATAPRRPDGRIETPTGAESAAQPPVNLRTTPQRAATEPPPRGGRWTAAAAGIAAGVAGAGIGELAAAIVAPGASPFAVIGAALIDLAPPWAKDSAITLFGTNDKPALLIGIAIVLLGLSALAGVFESRRPPMGLGLMVLMGGAGMLAALTRANPGPLDWVPSAIAALVGGVALVVLTPRMPVRATRAGETPTASGVPRRTFLAWTAGTAAIGVLAAMSSSLVRTALRTVTAVRDAIALPAAVTPAPIIPEGAELGIEGLATVITPNDEFYRIDTALLVPQVDPADWSLRIHGFVDTEVTLTWDELLALPLEESVTTLACVSNEVGGNLIGTATWLGYPIRELLARAGVQPAADMVLSRSIDGFTASTPLEVLTDHRHAILAIGMNGEPLPIEHGFPVRMVVPGLYGYVSATKWVTELEVTRFDAASAYWTDRGWSARGPIKLQSRIDVPRRGETVDAGETVIAGVAWQQHVGISGVEVQIDDGEWLPATLATAISNDTWVQWRMPWTAESGTHSIRCRATNALGEMQTELTRHVVPDGATGHHAIEVTVT